MTDNLRILAVIAACIVAVLCPQRLAAQAPRQAADSTVVADEFALTPDSVLLARPDSVGKTAVVKVNVDSLATRIADAMAPGFKPDPTRALWLGLILPGGGQIYNRKYWKLPIIYGGFLGCTYALSWNNQMLSDYSQAYLDIMDDDPNTKSYEKMLPINFNMSGREEQFKEIFKNRKNYYRKYRDMSILAFVAVYALSVIDAYVDAELSSFDISEDLSLQLQPTIITTDPRAHGSASDLARGGANIGFSFAVNF